MKQYLNGMNALAVSENDPIAPAKILKEYADKIETFNLIAGFVDGAVIDASKVEELAKTPSKEVLLGRLLGSIQAPLYSLARVLTAITEKDETAAPAAEAAPEAPATEEATAEAAPEAPAAE